jgi:hypothetical protein
MTSLSSPFQIHSPSIPTPTESESSFRKFLTPTVHQIIPLSRCFSLVRFELTEETVEKERMSTNSQILVNLDLERRLSVSRRDAQQGGVAKLVSL